MSYGILTTFILAGVWKTEVGHGYSSPIHTWPLPYQNPLLGIKSQQAKGKQCSLASGEVHTTLQYSGIYAAGNSHSYADVIVDDVDQYEDYAFSIFAMAVNTEGTIFHYKHDSSAVDKSVEKIKDVILWYNNTHLVVDTLGPNDEDYGSVSRAVNSADFVNNWTGFGISYDVSKPKLKLMTNAGVESEMNTLNSASIGTPGRIRVGSSFESSRTSFQGDLICLNMYSDKIPVGDLPKTLQECDSGNWAHITAEAPVVTCNEFKGHFDVKEKDSTLQLPVTSLNTMNTTSSVKCADLCWRTELCWSFTINKVNGLCRLFDGDYSSSTVSSVGTHYYMQRDECC